MQNTAWLHGAEINKPKQNSDHNNATPLRKKISQSNHFIIPFKRNMIISL